MLSWHFGFFAFNAIVVIVDVVIIGGAVTILVVLLMRCVCVVRYSFLASPMLAFHFICDNICYRYISAGLLSLLGYVVHLVAMNVLLDCFYMHLKETLIMVIYCISIDSSTRSDSI